MTTTQMEQCKMAERRGVEKMPEGDMKEEVEKNTSPENPKTDESLMEADRSEAKMPEQDVEEAGAKNPTDGVQSMRLHGVDSPGLEAGRVSTIYSHSQVNWMRTLSSAFQTVGVVYGDIGTSPLYVYSSTFQNGVKNNEDILGVLSLIIYTIALIPFLKYAFVVLNANDNGDGGTFALYSRICRYANLSLIPNHQQEDQGLSNYKVDTPPMQLSRSQKIKDKLESSQSAKIILFLVTIMGTSMVIGDGMLTPSISVLSAVSGIKSLHEDAVVGTSIVILIFLFCFQHIGTQKVGFSFAPIMIIWFVLISGIGLYNLFHYDVGVLRSINPKYTVQYFSRNGNQAWLSLGGILLCITGAEAMFADLGHFSVQAIQVGFSCITFPALIIAYSGQAAFLTKNPKKVADTFYASIPGPLYWPTFMVAVAASIIASQAMISGAFSIVSQSLTLGCFPWVKVVYTSAKHRGQVFIPEVNYIFMFACIILTAVFKTTEQIGNAYGIAVVSVMVITTCLVSLIMLLTWEIHIIWIILFFMVFGSIELVYLSSVLSKFIRGGYLPLVFSIVLMAIMLIWHYVHKKCYMFELNNKVPDNFIRDLVRNPEMNRIPGIGLLCSELVKDIPPVLLHLVSKIPSIHSVFIILTIRKVPLSKVELEERFIFLQFEPRDFRMFRCLVRYGYNDAVPEPREFEQILVQNLIEFIRREYLILDKCSSDQEAKPTKVAHSSALTLTGDENTDVPVESLEHPSTILPNDASMVPASSEISLEDSSTSSGENLVQLGSETEVQFVQSAVKRGVVYLLGEVEVVAEPNSSWVKKIIVNNAYNFLRKNLRHRENIIAIPTTSILRVGMTYEI